MTKDKGQMDYTRLSDEELQQLINKKDGDAICELGERCMYGTQGHEINLTRAYQLFHKGEKMGLARAYIALGEMYRKGIQFMKNEDIAREYYRKAGASYPGSQVSNDLYENVQRDNYSRSTKQAEIDSISLRKKLDQAEGERQGENYYQAKNYCNEVIRMIENARSGIVSYVGKEDLDDILIDAYWLMAYIAFNEQKYQEMERYLSQSGVQALHPWGVYLLCIGHRVVQASSVILEQDLQLLITVCNNQNLSQSERGDVFSMIADLMQEGYGKNYGVSRKMIKSYYKQAMECGNAYATKQYKNM